MFKIKYECFYTFAHAAASLPSFFFFLILRTASRASSFFFLCPYARVHSSKISRVFAFIIYTQAFIVIYFFVRIIHVYTMFLNIKASVHVLCVLLRLQTALQSFSPLFVHILYRDCSFFFFFFF